MDAEKIRVARDKLTRVFRYLEALNQHRNPAKRQIHEQPWSFWLRDLPDHPSIQRGAGKTGSSKTETGKSQGTEYGGANFVLKVQRPRLTRAPEPPEEIAAWLEDGWDDPSKALTVEEALEESEKSTEPRIVTFANDPARPASLERWKLLRNEWVKTEKPARAAMKIFESFYALYGRIDREAERVELVLGDGILSWRRAEGGIYHPILLQRLQLQFDASVPEFTLSEADHPVELYSALFQTMNDVDGRAIGRCREDLPWSLLNIVGEELPTPDAGDANRLANCAAQADGEVLLSKPANPEQIRIARQLEEHGGVLVQGPPGTGKTHTIGNLVGHLLAQGKSVLVTSH